MKILIVDDSTAMRMIVRRTLRQAGFEGHDIVEADDGAKALAASPYLTGLKSIHFSGRGTAILKKRFKKAFA